MDKIAFVCQRYGAEVVGGSEAECRMYAERLTKYFSVEVITTCALDAESWTNHYSSGVTELNGVKVRRFRVEGQRDIAKCAALEEEIKGHSHSDEAEEKWLKAQGPYCPTLVNYLEKHGMDYEAVLFMTYLFYPTAVGIHAKTKKTIFVPTAHDEWPIYQRIYSRAFDSADQFIYNAPAEKRFVERIFPSTAKKTNITVGAGVTYPAGTLPSVQERFGVTSPYICYSGRIDHSKGCGTLFYYFEKYQKTHDGKMKLILTGKAAMDIPKRPDIIPLGFVSEEEKYAVMQNAVALVLASEFESLSIVVLESMMMGRPVLVNGECEVLKDHCIQSNAGFYFLNYKEFAAELDYLLEHKAEYDQMCDNGRQYVKEHYQWDHIIQQIVDLIKER